MMKNKFYFLTLVIFIFLGFTSCNKGDDGDPVTCTGAWSTELSDEINAVSTAGVTYSNDPTSANCLAYKDALQNYLNALEPYGDCAALTGEQRTQWEVAVGEAQANIDDMECN